MTVLPLVGSGAIGSGHWLRLLRHFPYTGFLLPLGVVLAVLVRDGAITRLSELLVVLPFSLLLAAGYAYNNAADRADPAEKRNPVATGEISARVGVAAAILFAGAAVLLLVGLLHSPVARVMATGHVALIGAYSGAGARLKETLLGPPAAAVGLYAAAPTIVAVEYGVVADPIGVVIAGAALLFTGREIAHSVNDAASDTAAGYLTFGRRAGARSACYCEAAMAVVGSSIVVAGASQLAVPSWCVVIVGVLLATAAVTVTIAPARTRYGLVKLAFVALAMGLLGLPTVPAVLLLFLSAGTR